MASCAKALRGKVAATPRKASNRTVNIESAIADQNRLFVAT